jgi:methylated-DNA-[protein]-cysteine S-methyltransferase
VPGGFDVVRRQLAEYFAGTRTGFSLPLAPAGDPFDVKVWEMLGAIGYGETKSYGDLARQLGDVVLSQAVGAAIGRNPLSVVVPCHRVVGSDGRLVGYAGGLARKRWLLDLEQSDSRLF